MESLDNEETNKRSFRRGAIMLECRRVSDERFVPHCKTFLFHGTSSAKQLFALSAHPKRTRGRHIVERVTARPQALRMAAYPLTHAAPRCGCEGTEFVVMIREADRAPASTNPILSGLRHHYVRI
jgi:hypothetical protein